VEDDGGDKLLQKEPFPSLFPLLLPVHLRWLAGQSVVSTRIICLGNELVRDDGAGIRVGEILQRLPLPPGVQVELRPQLGFDLLDVVAGVDRVILVDAMSTGRAPGTCVTLDGQAIERYSAGASLSHALSIAELMALARTLAPERPAATLCFVGVEGVAFTEFGMDLSPEVAAAIPVAVDAVLCLLGGDEELRAAGRAASAGR
jgi:hydrogenase maturation protease